MDVILSIRRGEGNTRATVRIIESLGRFDETPDKLVVELTEHGYRSLGDASAFAEEEAMKAIVDLLPVKEENAMTTAEVLDKLKEHDIKRTMAMDALAKLATAGTVKRVGEGKRGNPYRYLKPMPGSEKDSSATPSLGSDERNAKRRLTGDDTPNEHLFKERQQELKQCTGGPSCLCDTCLPV